jgi:predicted DNA-binding transcriptional regulator
VRCCEKRRRAVSGYALRRVAFQAQSSFFCSQRPYVLRGISTESIARELEISQETVKTHVHSIFKKSGTHSRAEFLAAVLRSR